MKWTEGEAPRSTNSNSHIIPCQRHSNDLPVSSLGYLTWVSIPRAKNAISATQNRPMNTTYTVIVAAATALHCHARQALPRGNSTSNSDLIG